MGKERRGKRMIRKTLTDLHDADALSVEIERYMRETGNEVVVTWRKVEKRNEKHVPLYSPGEIRGMSLQEMIDCATRAIFENDVTIKQREDSNDIWNDLIRRAKKDIEIESKG
jgi:hypothetical protein